MKGRRLLGKWLCAQPLRGMPMLLCMAVALIAPTLIRTSVEGVVREGGFLVYFPFVLLAAVVLEWQSAAGLAAASAGLADLLFVGPKHQLLETPSDLFGISVFAAASALAIGLAHAFRKTAANPPWLNSPKQAPKGIVFSQEGGQVYASWYGGRSFVPMGPEAEVAKMMRDFLSQRDVAERLASRNHVEHLGNDDA